MSVRGGGRAQKIRSAVSYPFSGASQTAQILLGSASATVPPTGCCSPFMSAMSLHCCTLPAATTTAVATEQKREQQPRAGVQGQDQLNERSHGTTDR